MFKAWLPPLTYTTADASEWKPDWATYQLRTAFRNCRRRWNDICALPIVAAIEHDHEFACFDMAEGVAAVVVLA